jgi:tRNA A-37 threonylcarbamoyl transferase component Bud32
MVIRTTGVLRAGPGEDGRAWADALSGSTWQRSARTIKSTAEGTVLAADVVVAGRVRAVVIKARRLGGALDTLKSRLRMGRGDRHARGAALLESQGVGTARVLALLRADIDGPEHEVLVLERLEGPTLLEVMAEAREGSLGFGARRMLARAVGAQIAALARTGVRNRDHKPSNIIVTRLDDRAAGLAVIDCVGITRRRLPGSIARVLACLVIEPMGTWVLPTRADRLRALVAFVEGVLMDIGPAAPEGLSDRDRRRVAWSVWRSVEAIVRRHGDARPRDNPLAGRRG